MRKQLITACTVAACLFPAAAAAETRVELHGGKASISIEESVTFAAAEREGMAAAGTSLELFRAFRAAKSLADEELVSSEAEVTGGRSTFRIPAEGGEDLQKAVCGADLVCLAGEDGGIRVLLNRDGTLACVSEIPAEGRDRTVHGLYWESGTLYVVTGPKETAYGAEPGAGSDVTVSAYDVTDPETPKAISRISQEGRYRNAVVKDGCLYLFAAWTPVLGRTPEKSTLTPEAGGKRARPEEMYVPATADKGECLVMTSVQLERPDAFADIKAAVAGTDALYIGRQAVYAACVSESGADRKTEIMRFLYDDGVFTPSGSNTIKGEAVCPYSLHESDGRLYALSEYMEHDVPAAGGEPELLEEENHEAGADGTPEENTGIFRMKTCAAVFDGQMEQLGQIDNPTDGHIPRNAFYADGRICAVTFGSPDPVYVIDFRDLSDIRVGGKSELPGYTEGFLRLEDGLFVSIGYQTDGIGAITGLRVSGIRIAGEGAPEETGSAVVRRVNYCDAFTDPDLFCARTDLNLIGFLTDNRLMVYRVQKDGSVRRVLLYDLYEDDLQDADGPVYLSLKSDKAVIASDRFAVLLDFEEKERNKTIWTKTKAGGGSLPAEKRKGELLCQSTFRVRRGTEKAILSGSVPRQ